MERNFKTYKEWVKINESKQFKTYKERLDSKTEEYVRENGKLFEAAKNFAYEQTKFGTFPGLDGKYPEPDMHELKFCGLQMKEAFIQGACWKADELMDMVCEWIYNHQGDADIPNIDKYVGDLIKDMGMQQYKNE